MQRGSSGGVAIRQPYLRLLHLELDTGMSAGTSAFGSKFSPEEEEEFAHMARSEGFYETFATSVAPSIYGTVGVLSTVLESCAAHFPSSDGSSVLLIRRYQKSHHLLIVWWLQESATRWHALAWGYQCPSPWRPWHSQVSITQVR